MARVVIDPGHGGTMSVGDSSPNNATGPAGLKEKVAVLDVAKRIQRDLMARGHSVKLTRDTDRNLSLIDRAKVAKTMKADVFVSVHFNGNCDPGVQGTETWIHSDHSGASKALADRVQFEMARATGLRNRGVKSRSDNLKVLIPDHHYAGTAVCLAEISFITDPAEETRLNSDRYKDAVAKGIADGIERYVGSATTSA